MKQMFTASSVEEAKAAAAAAFGVSESEITFNVIEEPKKGLFGKVKGEAKVEAEYEAPAPVAEEPAPAASTAPAAEVTQEVPAQAEEAAAEPDDRDLSEAEQRKTDAAVAYIREILVQMGIENISVVASPAESGINIELSGDGFAELIGKKGDLLDALQYLSSLVCNKIDREYFRITTDCNGFRARRKAQLERLAHKLANNVKRSGRTHALEPMNPYERRIIHAAISEIEGVTSKSVGEEPYRKVVISSTEKRPYNNRGRGGRGGRNGGRNGGNRRRPQPHYDITTSFEKDYKKPKPEDDMDLGSGVYGKLNF
ncbi:MAG: protein jag [Ruminococcus sp.]|nr:protein jag [Ruminococcus sp.]